MTDPTDLLHSRRKVRDRSMVHLLVGILLLMPPVIGIAQMEGKIAGLPITFAYVFGVWGMLIVVALLLARPLAASDKPLSSDDMTDNGP